MCAYCFETLSEPGGVFRDSSAASIDYEALEEDMNGERRNLLHGYRGARLEEVSDPEHWMALNHFESEDSDMEGERGVEDAEEEIAIDSPTQERGEGREPDREPPVRRRRVQEEPEPEDQEELAPEQLDMIRGGVRILEKSTSTDLLVER